LASAGNSLDFLAGGGKTGALMRGLDWSSSPLGHPSAWPQSLRSVVGLLLQSQFPMFVAWGSELGFLYNDPYAEILGAKHPKALGSRFYDIWSEIWPDISPLIDAAMSGQATYREDLALLMNRKGFDEQTWFTFSYSPVREESGKVAGMFCAVWETTSKVVAERSLRTSEGRLHALVTASSYVIYRMNADWTEMLELEGQGFIADTQAPSETWLGRYVHPDDQPQVTAAIRKAIAGKTMFELEHRVRRLDGSLGWTLSRAVPITDAKGAIVEWFGAASDVTDRKRTEEALRDLNATLEQRVAKEVAERAKTEEALRQAQKMEAVGQLTGGVAHDFNNLLAVLSGGLQLLERNPEPARRRFIVDGMRHSVERGISLTRQLLTFSRQRALSSETIDLAAHIGGMRDMLSRALRGDINVEMSFATGLWPVEVDVGELERAMLNLSLNARDAMEQGGKIKVVAKNATDAGGAAFVKLSVSDDGAGMSPEVRARAFEPFFTTKEVGKGSGLGLAQVYGFANQSGGRVEIESEVGVGTTVILFLPRSHKAPSSETERAKLGNEGAGRHARGAHVLLVEDDERVAGLTAEMLDSIGMEVTHVRHVSAALDALAEELQIDIVFSDVMMPGGKSGLDLAAEVRSRRPGLPIVLTTGYAEAAAGARRAGIPVLLKPYQIEALADALGAALCKADSTRPSEGTLAARE
jgi:signal transduction histidine kinase/ActR/RegA family two-component response regulator